MNAPDIRCPLTDRGSQRHKRDVRGQEHSFVVEEQSAVSDTQRLHQAFQAGELADGKTMSSRLECGKVSPHTGVEGSRSLDPLDEDAGVEINQHFARLLALGRWKGAAPQLLTAPFVVLVLLLAGHFLGLHFLRSPPLVSPGPLALANLVHDLHQPPASGG